MYPLLDMDRVYSNYYCTNNFTRSTEGVIMFNMIWGIHQFIACAWS